MTEVTSAVLEVPGSVGRVLGYLVCQEARVGSRLGLPFILLTSGKLLTSSFSAQLYIGAIRPLILGPLDTDTRGPLILMCSRQRVPASRPWGCGLQLLSFS